jgi:hypothetical protein
MWIVVYRPNGADREQQSTPFPTRAEAETQAAALKQHHDVLRIERSERAGPLRSAA